MSEEQPAPAASSTAAESEGIATTTQQRQYVTLVSQEGFEFILDREAAEQSGMIHDMVQGYLGYGETDLRIPLEDINARVLDLVCQYLSERRAAKNSMSEFKQLAALDPSVEQDRQLVLEVLLAADYLDC